MTKEEKEFTRRVDKYYQEYLLEFAKKCQSENPDSDLGKTLLLLTTFTLSQLAGIRVMFDEVNGTFGVFVEIFKHLGVDVNEEHDVRIKDFMQ